MCRYIGEQKLYVQFCVSCGVPFALHRDYEEARRRDAAFFYCPNGHRQHYTETEEQRLQKQLEDAQSSTAYWRSLHAASQRSKAAIQGQVTKLRKRAEGGLCPFPNCHRYFEKLRRHIGTVHKGQSLPGEKPGDTEPTHIEGEGLTSMVGTEAPLGVEQQ